MVSECRSVDEIEIETRGYDDLHPVEGVGKPHGEPDELRKLQRPPVREIKIRRHRSFLNQVFLPCRQHQLVDDIESGPGIKLESRRFNYLFFRPDGSIVEVMCWLNHADDAIFCYLGVLPK